MRLKKPDLNMRALVGGVLLMILAGGGCAWAEDPRGRAVVTISTGALTVELSERAAWTVQRLIYNDAEVGTPTGAYGVALSIPAIGGWVGSAHSDGGVEQIQEISLTVDGQPAELADEAAYACERAVLSKRSLLDKVRLDATLTFEGQRLLEHHVLTATEDVVVSRVYPFMHCLTNATTAWIAQTAEGVEDSGHFTDSKQLAWHAGWRWTAAYDPASEKGLLLRYLDLPEGVQVQTGYWDQERYRKLYAQLMTGDILREGTVLDCQCVVTCFEAPPGVWRERARQVAAELVAE